VADVCVGNVNLEFEYKAGREEANKLLVTQFGASKAVDWDALFSDPNIDHLRPTGEYVGSKSEDTGENDEELGGPSMHNFLDSLNSEPPDGEEETGRDFRNNADADALELDEENEDGPHPAEQEIINPVIVNEAGITFPAAAPSKFLDYNGKSQHKLSLVPRLLESPSARKVTIRPLRARGVTIADSIQQRTALERLQHATGAGDSGKMKAGDIGAILCRVEGSITLAVVEVLSFRQSGSKDLPSIDVDELEGTGSRSVSVAVEIVQLRCMEPENAGSSSDASWVTNQLYVQTVPSARDGSTTSKNFILRVPGTIIHPLGPDIHWEMTPAGNEIPCWKLQESELEEIMEYAWECLNPDSNEIIANIELLPEIKHAGHDFPYHAPEGTAKFCLQESVLPLQLSVNASNPDAFAECLLCTRKLRIRDLRNHVGKHIILDLRNHPDPSLKDSIEVIVFSFFFEKFHSLMFLDRSKSLWMVWARRCRLQDPVNHKENCCRQHHVFGVFQLRIPTSHHVVLSSSKAHQVYTLHECPSSLPTLPCWSQRSTTDILEIQSHPPHDFEPPHKHERVASTAW